MPTIMGRIVILTLWMGTSLYLVREELLPQLVYGELTYRTVLADHAVEEATHWLISVNDKRVGSVVAVVRPDDRGEYTLWSRGSISSSLLPTEQDRPSTQILLATNFHISSLGKLREFNAEIKLEGTNIRAEVTGVVEDGNLVVTTTGLPLVSGETRMAVDPETLVVNLLTPLDRIPDLWVGKQWTTRVVNPFAALLPTAAGGLLGGKSFDVIQHAVVGIEPITWNNAPVPCHVIEHKHDRVTSRSWVRIRDGRVLRQEVPIGGLKVTLELDTLTDKGME